MKVMVYINLSNGLHDPTDDWRIEINN